MSTARVTVRSGDTVGALALRHGVSQASILKANGLSAGSLIVAGRTLRIPVPTGFSGNTFAGRTYSSAVVGAAGTNRGYLAGSALPSRSSTRAMIIETASRHGLDPRLALAIAWQESAWSQRPGLRGERHRRHAGHPQLRRLGLLPGRSPPEPPRHPGQHHRRGGHPALADPRRGHGGGGRGRVTTRAWPVCRRTGCTPTPRRTSAASWRSRPDVADRSPGGRGASRALPGHLSRLGGVSAAVHPTLVGRVLDRRYRVLSHIADGGMASVYVALDSGWTVRWR